MAATSILYVIYGVVLLAGGAMGYAKAKSAPSLVAGVVSALAMFVAVVMVQQHHTKRGLVLGAVVGAVMDAVFLGRYMKTRKAMPAIPIAVLSFVVFAFSIAKLFLK